MIAGPMLNEMLRSLMQGHRQPCCPTTIPSTDPVKTDGCRVVSTSHKVVTEMAVISLPSLAYGCTIDTGQVEFRNCGFDINGGFDTRQSEMIDAGCNLARR